MTERQREGVELLLESLGELAADAAVAARDGRLDVSEVLELGEDVLKIGRAIKSLVVRESPRKRLGT
jgi:hypothetical protein